MKIRREKLDILFSELVREAADWHCQKCMRKCFQGDGILDCSHFYGRRHRVTRWHPDNVAAHCKSCHRWLQDRPMEFAAWIRGFLGDVRYDRLRERHRQSVKYTKTDKLEMSRHYRSELTRIRAERMKGATGEFTIVPWD